MSGPTPSPGHEPLPRTVKVLGAVSLAQDAGSEMLYPLLPRFVTGTLGAPVAVVGVAEGLADATAAGMKLLAGRFAEGRRRPWIAAGYAIATLGKAIVALAFAWPVVVLGRAVDRIGKGIRGVPRDALLADATAPGSRGRAFGFHRSADTTGAVLGPLLGLLVLHLLDGRIRVAIALALVPAALSVALVAFVHEARRDEGDETSAPPLRRDAEPGPARLARALPAGVWPVLAPLVVFGLVNSTDALLLQHAGDVGLSTTQVVAVYVLFNVVAAALGYPVGRLVDRVPHRIPFAVGLLVFAVVYVGLGRLDSGAAVWILLPLYGVFPACTEGVGRAWLTDLAPAGSRTWVLGVHGATTGLAVLVAGLWSGLAWGDRGAVPLTVSGIVAGLVAGWLLLWSPAEGRPAAR